MQAIHEAPLVQDGWSRALPVVASAIRSGGGIFLVQNANRVAEFITDFGMAAEHVQTFAGRGQRQYVVLANDLRASSGSRRAEFGDRASARVRSIDPLQ